MPENIVKIKVFAELKELIGDKSLVIKLENNISLVDFLHTLSRDFPIFSNIIKEINKKYKLYINGNLIDSLEIEIKSNDEIAILPPVGGG